MYSLHIDTEAYVLMFNAIFRETGRKFTPRVFMSDLANAMFNAWVEVMGVPGIRLYCSWHVMRAWRDKLKKLFGSTTEEYKQIKTALREVRDELDPLLFESKLLRFCKSLQSPKEEEFKIYFQDYYIGKQGEKKLLWAYCHRKMSGINTNMRLENLHK